MIEHTARARHIKKKEAVRRKRGKLCEIKRSRTAERDNKKLSNGIEREGGAGGGINWAKGELGGETNLGGYRGVSPAQGHKGRKSRKPFADLIAPRRDLRWEKAATPRLGGPPETKTSKEERWV